MDILILLKIIIRRWVVTLPVLLIVVVTGYNSISALKPQYESSADVILLSPTQQIDATGKITNGNPFIDFRAGINVTAAIIQTIVTDGPHHETLADEKLSLDYNVTVNSAAPIMTVTAKAEQPAIAEATVTAVANFISTELQKNQDAVNAPPETRVTSRLLTMTKAYTLAGDRSRVAAAVGAVGFAAIIGAALLAESIVSGRRRRRGRRHDAELAALLADSAGSGSEPDSEPITAMAPWAPAQYPDEEVQPGAFVPDALIGQDVEGEAGSDGRPRSVGRKRRAQRQGRRAGAPAQPHAPEL